MAVYALAPGDIIVVPEEHYRFGKGTLVMRLTDVAKEAEPGWWFVHGHVIVDGREVRHRFASVELSHVRLRNTSNG